MQRRQVIFLIIAAILVAVLTFLLTTSSLIQDVIAPGVFFFTQFVYGFLNSLPQLLVWLLFVLFVFQFFLGGIARYIGRILEQRGQEKEEPEEESMGPVERYSRWINQVPQGEFFRVRLGRALADLTMQSIGRAEKLSQIELEQAMRVNQLQLPENINTYLQKSIVSSEVDDGGLQRIRNIATNTRLAGVDADQLDSLLGYLENELDINDGVANG